jgi:CRP/FNR family transcriptional regulator, cyclic AMP receptor protein
MLPRSPIRLRSTDPEAIYHADGPISRRQPLVKAVEPLVPEALVLPVRGIARPTNEICAPFNPKAFLAVTGAGRVVGAYEPQQVIFHQGDAADAVFYIQKGRVQITILSGQGKEGVIAVLDAGQFFGEGCLAGQDLNAATATAMTHSAIVKIDKRTMTRVLRDEPTASHMFMAFLLSRNIQVEADLVDHLFNCSEKRLARILWSLGNVGGEGRVATVPNVNQEALASRVGTTRSRINFFMNKFRKLGFIEYDSGSLKINPSLMSVVDQG